MKDDDLRRHVAAELSWDPQVGSETIEVSAASGLVTLRGTDPGEQRGLVDQVVAADRDLATIRLEMDTIFFGTLAVTRAFTPQLAAHGSSAVLNILSALS